MANDPTPTLRTPLGRVRGLGAAHRGTGHWWSIRVTALALIPLTVWFVVTVIRLAGAPYEDVVAWLGSPVSAILMLLTIGFTFHHAANGMQEVYEDYIHTKLTKLLVIALTKGLALVLALTAAFAVLSIAFRG